MLYDETEFRAVAWEVISQLSVVRLLEDCVDALVDAYTIDEELFIADKQMLQAEDTEEISMPMHTYINTVIEKEQEESDVTVTE